MPTPGDIGRIQTLNFLNVASGWYPHAPARSLDPERGPCWRKLVNMRFFDGYLEKRRSLHQAKYQFDEVKVDQETDASEPVGILGYPEERRIEHPVYLNQVEAKAAPDSTQLLISTILVTTTDIYIIDPEGGWTVATPTYETGTVAVTSGNNAITGTGTAFITRNVLEGHYIRINGKFLTITGVNSNTELIVSPAPDVTASGISTYVRRAFHTPNNLSILSNSSSIHVTMHNGDLYVAGNNVGGPDNPAVIRVRHFTSDPLPGSYLMAQREIEGGMDSFDNLIAINGMVNLPDGRVLLATVELDPDVDADTPEEWLAQSRLRYSSHLDVHEWVDEPAGFVDDVNGGEGRITAIAPFGRQYAIHYRDAITIGSLTGLDEPPLQLSPSRAHVGTAHYRTIKMVNGSHLFVGHDGAIYRFNGLYTEQVNNSFRDRTRQFKRNRLEWLLHAHLDEFRNEYQVYMVNEDSARKGISPGIKAETEVFAVDVRTFAPRWEVLPVYMTAVSDKFLGSVGIQAVAHSDRDFASDLGVTKIDNNLDPISPFFRFREGFPEDIAGFNFEISDPSEEIEAQTDDLHFGWPGQHQGIERVVLYMFMPQFNRVSTDTNRSTYDATVSDVMTVGVSTDGGVTFTTKSATVTYTGGSRWKIQEIHYRFDELATSEHHRFRFVPVDKKILYGAIAQIQIRYWTAGETEATGEETQAA
jgi:hypothetical protein